jgi:hypothetical protein
MEKVKSHAALVETGVGADFVEDSEKNQYL